MPPAAPDPALALGRRDALPEPLRVLLDNYPRAAWEADPGFSALIRFWLDRHLMFRDLLARLTEESARRVDGASDSQAYARAVSRLGGLFAQELHTHHLVEDQHYFPVLAGRDARLEHGFGLLDADHHALDGQIHGFVEAANAVLRADADTQKDAAGRLHGLLTGFAPLLDRHLTDEEDLIVPVLLKYGEAGLA